MEGGPAPTPDTLGSESCDGGDDEDDAAVEQLVVVGSVTVRGGWGGCGAGVFVEAQLAPAAPCRWDDM